MATKCCAPGTEFHPRSFLLDYPSPELFVTAQWQSWHRLVYVIYRIAAAIFFFGWIIETGLYTSVYAITEADRIKWFIYQTNWAFFLLTLDAILQAIEATWAFVRHRQGKSAPEVMTWHYKALWVIHNLAVVNALATSISYWALIYNGKTDAVDIVTHAINSVYVIINMFITAIPMRFLHFWHGLLYGITYVVFAAIYTVTKTTNAEGEPYIYTIFDWVNDPKSAAIYSVILVIAIPVVWILLVVSLYQLRMLIYRALNSKRGQIQNESGPMKEAETREYLAMQ